LEQMPADHGSAAPAKIVQTVRAATGQFINVNAATAAGYQPLSRLVCQTLAEQVATMNRRTQ
jgi:hypothetical protein